MSFNALFLHQSKRQLWAHQWQLAMPIYLRQNLNSGYFMTMNKDTNVNQFYA